VKELAAPLCLRAHRNLRRLHQQKAQQYAALFADVSQSPPLAAVLTVRLLLPHPLRADLSRIPDP
jgi:hypothetical protein